MSSSAHSARLDAAYQLASSSLLAMQESSGHWEGELSSSALSTATAVVALWLSDRYAGTDHRQARAAGLRWLVRYVNADGGWGDTVASRSNLSTTVLVWAAFASADSDAPDPEISRVVANAARWISIHAGGLDRQSIATAVIRRYGKDRTFSVPILTLCALTGRLGTGREAWNSVIPLPFELAAFPRRWFAALKLPVVSYALPALIAIGQARFVNAPPRNPILWLLRFLTQGVTLRVLESIQPSNGGFLEATPLTSFVTMSLLGSGHADHPVVGRGLEFLRAAQRADGSWPIDTHLATWVTTLAINASEVTSWEPSVRHAAVRWLQDQQYREVHPYTLAAPGGWAWSPLPGGVPDADDTAGALLALHRLAPEDPLVLQSVELGIRWLLSLQNRDGGIPTFCRGWGTLPFDRSSTDITAHALRAWRVWLPSLGQTLQMDVKGAMEKALTFLQREQSAEGAWLPLWFGNEWVAGEGNPMYGTSRVLRALAEVEMGTEASRSESSFVRGLDWILGCQHSDGGFGGAFGIRASVEETALAVEALAAALHRWGARLDRDRFERLQRAVNSGAVWLVERVETGEWTHPTPIGFYFAKLWYSEKLYPQIWAVAALRAVRNLQVQN